MVLGKCPEKLSLLDEAGIKTTVLGSFRKSLFDIVIGIGQPFSL